MKARREADIKKKARKQQEIQDMLEKRALKLQKEELELQSRYVVKLTRGKSLTVPF